jgi:hypothetical protein
MKAEDYIDSKIAEFDLRIKALEAEKDNIRNLPGEYKEYKVGCSENNSGGSFWLGKEDYASLEKEGFVIFMTQRAFYKKVKARNVDEAIMMVKADFNAATKFDADDEGCNCCGQPFYFTVDDEFYWEGADTSAGGIRNNWIWDD